MLSSPFVMGVPVWSWLGSDLIPASPPLLAFLSVLTLLFGESGPFSFFGPRGFFGDTGVARGRRVEVVPPPSICFLKRE